MKNTSRSLQEAGVYRITYRVCIRQKDICLCRHNTSQKTHDSVVNGSSRPEIKNPRLITIISCIVGFPRPNHHPLPPCPWSACTVQAAMAHPRRVAFHNILALQTAFRGRRLRSEPLIVEWYEQSQGGDAHINRFGVSDWEVRNQ